jgi:hypothetical protein
MKVTVAVPESAEPGGHYAALIASSRAGQNIEGSAVNVTSELGTLFLIRVAGAAREEGSLNPPEVPGFSEYGPIDIGLVFNNLGNVHLKPRGKINVKNFLGQTVAEIQVPEWVVLPEAARRLVANWDSHYLFGRYTAEAEIFYADGQRIVVASSFWVIPWKIILAVVAALIVLVFLASRLTRERRRMKASLKRELDRMQTGGEAPPLSQGELSQPGAPMGAAAPTAAPEPSTLISLNELFPSMEDARVIDISDPETKKLLRNMIANELDLARTFVAEGRHDEARRELQEARYAAQRLGMLAEVGIIDDMMRWV